MPEAPFAFTTGTLIIGGHETPAERLDFTFERGDAPWPVPTERLLAGDLAVEGTLTGDLDPWFMRDWRCPGCGTRWADTPAGHSWSSARGHCWTETGPIDEYGRPLKEASDEP